MSLTGQKKFEKENSWLLHGGAQFGQDQTSHSIQPKQTYMNMKKKQTLNKTSKLYIRLGIITPTYNKQ